MSSAVLECVPTVREGCDRRINERRADAIRGVAGVRLADVHADPTHHRDAVAAEAARRGIAVARAELVGLAPRGAVDGRSPGSVALPDLTPAHYLDTHLDGLP